MCVKLNLIFWVVETWRDTGAFLIEIVLKKIQSKTHISLAYPEKSMYTLTCCGMIAMKREVAALCGRFSVERMSS